MKPQLTEVVQLAWEAAAHLLTSRGHGNTSLCIPHCSQGNQQLCPVSEHCNLLECLGKERAQPVAASSLQHCHRTKRCSMEKDNLFISIAGRKVSARAAQLLTEAEELEWGQELFSHMGQAAKCKVMQLSTAHQIQDRREYIALYRGPSKPRSPGEPEL